MIDGRDFRHALAAIAREMNRQVEDWMQLTERQHLGIASDALDHGDLAGGIAALLFAMERRERERSANA
jgi:hypothetical protein